MSSMKDRLEQARQDKSMAERLEAIETAIQLLAGNITNLRTELMVIKANVDRIAESASTELESR